MESTTAVSLREQRKRKEFWMKFLSYIILGIFSIVFVLPLVYTISTSIKYPADARSGSSFLPKKVINPWWYNFFGKKGSFKDDRLDYDGAFFAGSHGGMPLFAHAYINSIIVAVSVTLIQLITCSLAAYAFARLRWPGRDTVFLSYLGTMMVPGTVIMIPVFILFKSLHLIDTLWALIIFGSFSAYGTFMLRQFFLSIPAALEEAAVIDGATRLQILVTVIVPLSKTALSTLAIFTFLFQWNDFMWPLIAISKEQLKTLPIALQAFQSSYTAQWHLIMAASLIVLIPVVTIFILGQKYITKGIMMSGLK